MTSHQPDEKIRILLGQLRAFCFPGGENAARLVRGVKIAQRGEICLAPNARWVPFTAKQWIDAIQSSFWWEARFGGKLTSCVVTDAYGDGRGRLALKLGWVIPVKEFVGPDLDKGEIQRYLGEILLCPPMLLNHSSLEFTAAENRTLRLQDRRDLANATVDLEMDEEGHPIACRANRPRLVGKHSVLTPWSGTCQEFKVWEGLRVALRVEASWHLPEGPFTYFRGEVTSFTTCH